jgi:hypothetical protein
MGYRVTACIKSGPNKKAAVTLTAIGDPTDSRKFVTSKLGGSPKEIANILNQIADVVEHKSDMNSAVTMAKGHLNRLDLEGRKKKRKGKGLKGVDFKLGPLIAVSITAKKFSNGNFKHHEVNVFSGAQEKSFQTNALPEDCDRLKDLLLELSPVNQDNSLDALIAKLKTQANSAPETQASRKASNQVAVRYGSLSSGFSEPVAKVFRKQGFVVLPKKLPERLLSGLLELHERIFPRRTSKTIGSPVHVSKGMRSIGYYGPTQLRRDVWPERKQREVHRGTREEEALIADTADFLATQSGCEDINTRMFVDIMCSRPDQPPQRGHQDGVSPLLAYVVMISGGHATLFAPYEGMDFQRLNREKRQAFLDTAWAAAKGCKNESEAISAGMLEAGQIVAFNSCHIHKGPPVEKGKGSLRRTIFFSCETKETEVAEGVVFAETYSKRFKIARTRSGQRENREEKAKQEENAKPAAAKKQKRAPAPAPARVPIAPAVAAAVADPGSAVVAGEVAFGVVVAADNLAVGCPVSVDAGAPADATPQTIENWLTCIHHSFGGYAKTFDEAGCESVDFLSEIDSGLLDGIMAKAGVKPVHAMLIRKNHQALLA